MQLLKYLNSPYPKLEKKWKLILLISFFVAFFLFLFQPFGLVNFNSTRKLAILFGYGGVTFFILLLNLYFIESIAPSFFAEKNWTLIRQIIFVVWILFTIGLGNYFYSVFVFPGLTSGWQLFMAFEIMTLIVGIFPVVFVTLISHNTYLRKYGKLAKDLDSHVKHVQEPSVTPNMPKVIICNETGKEELKLDPSQLLCMESMGNYVTISWKNTEAIEKSTLRSTLGKIKMQLNDYPHIVQCHRAYIVNSEQVQKVKGNAQGYQLNLNSYPETIPVSRSYIDAFNQVFRR